VTPDSTPGDAMPLTGFVVPGMPNAHSHAFQRSIAGRTERAGGSGDSFWTWREAMYAAVENIEPDAFEAVATDAYVAMLEAGYTHVCEFHYVHRAPGGAAYARPSELSDRIVAAASTAGIGLTLLPVLYRYADFGAAAPAPRQARFVLTFDEYAALWQTLRSAYAGDPKITLGAAPHSLRAVGRDDLRELERLVRTSAPARARAHGHGTAAPLHIHVSEQEREVAACRAAFGTTPVALLADTVVLDGRWCLVHATHATDDELATIAAAGAVVGLCPTTEANLGDGIFATAAFAARGGRFAIGSDSNATIDVAEELRWLEYAQRLTLRRRNVLQDAATLSVGRYLYDAALRGGAQASGRRIGALAPGFRADAVALELPPGTTAADGDALLDTAIFRSGAWRVRDVVAGGRIVVHDGRHLARTHD